ncbi:MAG: type II toxin-antitoxin system VapC family toxin, partial [Angustibacter sp.]
MYILDTNILSELMRPRPDADAIQWLRRLPTQEVRITSLTVAETKTGICMLPDGSRRESLEASSEMLFGIFQARVLSFTRRSAQNYAEVVAHRKKLGRPIGIFDAQIAAIALQYRAVVVTRNTKDFLDLGLRLIN